MDISTYFQFILALVFVIALIGLFALAARRFGFGGAVATKGGQSRRLAVVEVRALDAKRKLVLVRRDAVEHLVVLGPASETLIEANIPAPGDFAGALRTAASAAPPQAASGMEQPA